MKKYTIWAIILFVVLIVLKLFKAGDWYWCALAAITALLAPCAHVPGRLRIRGQIIGLATAGSVIFLALHFSAGMLLSSLSASPYDLSLSGIFRNIIMIMSAITATELIRAYLIGVISMRFSKKIPIIASLVLFFSMLQINFFKMGLIDNLQSLVVFAATDILPVIANSCLLTLLVTYGGSAAGIVYCGISEVFMHIFPFIPSLPWVAVSAFGIAFPVLMSFFVWDQYKIMLHPRNAMRAEHVGGFTAALALSVVLVWFSVGVFPIYPSVVLTGSMEPLIQPGDVVLIDKIVREQEIYALEKGDIINFKREQISITHRISEVILDENENISFRTKGDNNASEDDQIVMPNDINGKIRNIVPKIGMPILLMYIGDPMPEGVMADEDATDES